VASDAAASPDDPAITLLFIGHLPANAPIYGTVSNQALHADVTCRG